MGQIWPKPPALVGQDSPTRVQHGASARGNGQKTEINKERVRVVPDMQKKTAMKNGSPRGFMGLVGVQGEVE